MNPADYGMTWQEVAEKRLAYIKRLAKQVADLKLLLGGRDTERSQLNRYITALHGLLEDEGFVLTDEFNAKADEIFNIETDGAPFNLHALIGKRIPWRVDYGDNLPYEIFVGASVEWDFDGNNTWALVDADRDRWLDYETAMAYLEREV
jgi:hypothetical protein